MRVTFGEVKQIRRRRGLMRFWFRCCRRKDKVVIVIVFEKVKEGTNIWVAIDNFALHPAIIGFRVQS